MKTISYRLGRLEAAQDPEGDGTLTVRSVYELSDDQLKAVADGTLVVFVTDPLPTGYVEDDDSRPLDPWKRNAGD